MYSGSGLTLVVMVMTGKSRPQGMPVRGLIEAGPVEPMQPPTTFGEMTKYRSVSIGRPGPTMVSHQPCFFVSGCRLAAC